MMGRLGRGLALAGLAALIASPALAASVVIWPVDPTIKKGERATAIWVENQGAEPMTVQIRAFGWSQSGGKEDLSEQDEVVASPPIATVAAGQRQLIRLIRRTPGVGPAEGSYRLLIDELPAPASAVASGGTMATLGVQMRYSIPLFTYNVDPATVGPILKTKVLNEGPERFLVLSNTGAKHARLVDLRGQAGGPSLMSGLVGYVLPGQTQRFTLPKGAEAGFVANVNGADQRLQPES